MKRDELMKLATEAVTDTLGLRMSLIRLTDLSQGWQSNVDKMLDMLRTGTPRYTLFVKGNSKLPFFSWSTLPLVTCPGMGVCQKWCYSLKAWRYPAAFFRQMQNTVLLRIFGYRKHITAAFQKLPKGATLRLYVDGDFDSVDTLKYWMELLKTRPDVQAYGYSKSLHLFAELRDSGYEWPTNYLLNLSSGGIYQSHWVDGIPVVRDAFIAVPIDKSAGKAGYGTPEYIKAVQQSAKDAGYGKVFVCPGKCGTCTRKGHACGRDDFRGIKIAIGIH